jgi:hypothetical protein
LSECEACKNGLGEPWERFIENMGKASPKSLQDAWSTWWKRTIDYRLAGCKRHAEEASDRRDYIQVEREVGLFSSRKTTPQQWLESRNEIRERGFKFWHPSGVHDPPHEWENIPRDLLEYRRKELDRFCYSDLAESHS